MKKNILLALSALFTAGLLLSAMAAEKKNAVQGHEVAVNGTLSCTYCAFAHGGKVCPEGCCLSCIKAGDPVLLIDKDGTRYLLMAKEMHKPVITPEREKMLGVPVKIKGVLAKAKGVQVIFVESINTAG